MEIVKLHSAIFDCGTRIGMCATIDDGGKSFSHAVWVSPGDLLEAAGALRGLADWVESVARGVENGPERAK